METPSVPLEIWILAAFDPVLIAVAAWLGWRADQFAKIFIAALAAMVASVLVGWLFGSLSVPWVAPVGGEYPTLLQPRLAGAIFWAGAAYGARRLFRR